MNPSLAKWLTSFPQFKAFWNETLHLSLNLRTLERKKGPKSNGPIQQMKVTPAFKTDKILTKINWNPCNQWRVGSFVLCFRVEFGKLW